MPTTLRGSKVLFLISTVLIIKEITSSSIGFTILVPSCILHLLCLLCEQRQSIQWTLHRHTFLKDQAIEMWKSAESRSIDKLLAGAILVWVTAQQIIEGAILVEVIWLDLAQEIASVLRVTCLGLARKIGERIQAGIGYAAQVRLYTLQFLCLFCVLAEDRIIIRARRHDLWSHCWHITALLIRFLTSQVFAVDFCSQKEEGSWMLIDRASGVVIAEKVVISSLSSSAPHVLYKGSVKRNNYYSRSRSGNYLISRPPQESELVKLVDKRLVKLWAHIINVGTDKAYKKSRTTYPGKHGHNVGSAALRNWAQGRDGSDEERAIQYDLGNPNPHTSIQMTSPPQKTSQTPPPPPQTPPSPTPQVQPPTPPPPPPPPTPPQVVGWFNFNFDGWFNFNFTGLAKIFLVINTTLVLAPPQILHSGGNSLSANDKTLLFGTKLFGFTGFILCSLAYNMRQGDIAAKLLTAFGCLATIFGLLLIVALGK